MHINIKTAEAYFSFVIERIEKIIWKISAIIYPLTSWKNIYIIVTINFRKFNRILIKRSGGTGPMMLQQPMCFICAYGAKSGRTLFWKMREGFG